MKKNFIRKAAVVLAAVCAIASCGMFASASAYADAAETGEAYTAVLEQTGENGHDVVTVSDMFGDSKKEKEPKNWGKIIGIAVAVSAIITGISIYFIYRGYKYNGMTEPYQYKNKAPLDLTEKEDVLIDVHVTSRHIERNNS